MEKAAVTPVRAQLKEGTRGVLCERRFPQKPTNTEASGYLHITQLQGLAVSQKLPELFFDFLTLSLPSLVRFHIWSFQALTTASLAIMV